MTIESLPSFIWMAVMVLWVVAFFNRTPENPRVKNPQFVCNPRNWTAVWKQRRWYKPWAFVCRVVADILAVGYTILVLVLWMT